MSLSDVFWYTAGVGEVVILVALWWFATSAAVAVAKYGFRLDPDSKAGGQEHKLLLCLIVGFLLAFAGWTRLNHGNPPGILFKPTLTYPER